MSNVKELIYNTSPSLTDSEQLLLFLISCTYDTFQTNHKKVKEALCSRPSPLSHHFNSRNTSLHTYTEVLNLSPLYPFLRKIASSTIALFQLPRETVEDEVLHKAGALPEQWAALCEVLPQFKNPQTRPRIPRLPRGTGAKGNGRPQPTLISADGVYSSVPSVRRSLGAIEERKNLNLREVPFEEDATITSVLIVPSRDTSLTSSTVGGFWEPNTTKTVARPRTSTDREIICKSCHPTEYHRKLRECVGWEPKTVNLTSPENLEEKCAIVARRNTAVSREQGQGYFEPSPPAIRLDTTQHVSNRGGRLTQLQREAVDEVRRLRGRETEKVRRECEDYFSRPFNPLDKEFSQGIEFDFQEVEYFIDTYARSTTIIVAREKYDPAAAHLNTLGFQQGDGARGGVRATGGGTTVAAPPGLQAQTAAYGLGTVSYIEQRMDGAKFDEMLNSSGCAFGLSRQRLWKVLLMQTQLTLPPKQRRKCLTVNTKKFMELLRNASVANNAPVTSLASTTATAHEVLVSLFHSFANSGLWIRDEFVENSGGKNLEVEQHRFALSLFEVSRHTLRRSQPVSSRDSDPTPPALRVSDGETPRKESEGRGEGGFLSILTFEDFCSALRQDPFHETLDGHRVHWSINFFNIWISVLSRNHLAVAEEALATKPKKRRLKKKQTVKKGSAGSLANRVRPRVVRWDE